MLSGIACTVYDLGVASTVHSYYGFGVADLQWKELVNRLSKSNAVVNRVKKSPVPPREE